MPIVKVQKRFHPNGRIQSETTLVDGLPNGVNRRWHSNGALAAEIPVRDGFCEGIAQHWNEKGELIGTFEIRDGTGVMLAWYDNGVLSSEMSVVKRQFTGRQRVWFEDGELVTQVFWIRGRKVSKKKYIEACKKDSSLPRYENEPKVQSWEQKMKRLAGKIPKQLPKPELVEAERVALQGMLADPDKCEARRWLKHESAAERRNLGELPNDIESLALVDDAYRAGASEVLVVKIHRDDQGMENSGTLLIRLPPTGKERKGALDWCNEQNGYQGFDPEGDAGQEWVVVGLD